MRIAVCLYGQPRKYKEGHRSLMKFLAQFGENPHHPKMSIFFFQRSVPNITYDFFFHCWTTEPENPYPCSDYRPILESELICDDHYIQHKLVELYRPVEHIFEPQKTEFEEYYVDSIVYSRTSQKKLRNIKNTMSQLYSKNQVKNLFCQHIGGNTGKYQAVIATRFDNCKIGESTVKSRDIFPLYANRLCISTNELPRKIMPEYFAIMSVPVFIHWFNAYDNLPNLLNNEMLIRKMYELTEYLDINQEEIMLAN
jgi:hypothetical protein